VFTSELECIILIALKQPTEEKSAMNILKNADIENIECDLESGFVWAEGEQSNSNLFQACLVQRVDGKGYKKEINCDDSGYDWGLSADHNGSVEYSDYEASHQVFIKACRKAGFKIS
jgi:hypothetical protein